jgi:hypothetical protein
MKSDINGRLASLELVAKPKERQEETPTKEELVAWFNHSVAHVRQCLEAGKAYQAKGQRGRDDFFDEVSCLSCSRKEWRSVLFYIKYIAKEIGWTTSTVSAHGNKYFEREPHTLDELRWWLDYLEGMANEAE